MDNQSIDNLSQEINYKHLEDYLDQVITKEEVITNPVLAWDIKAIALKDFNVSYAYMSKKLTMWRDWYNQYTKPYVFKDQVLKIHYAMQQIQQFKAIYFENKLGVKFGAEELGDDELWWKLDKVAEHDYRAMEKYKRDLKLLDYIGFYGCGIEIYKWYDNVKDIPMYDVVNPETWLPDPNGNVLDDNFEYHMFILKTTMFRYETVNRSNPWTYFNLDQITTWSFREYEYQDYTKKITRLLSTYEDYRKNIRATVYYKLLNGRRYLIELANNNSLIIRFEEVKPIMKEEKENPWFVKCWVNVYNMIPIDGDPTGIGIMELTLDKQWAINRIANMSLLKEQRNAWFDNYIVDLNVIQNLNLLTLKPLNWPNFIPGKTLNGWPISNAIAPVTETPISANAIPLMDKIDLIGQYETGFTNQSRGTQQTGDTLWQAKQQMMNANVLFSLTSDVIGFGILWFWKNIWYRSIVGNIAKSKKKQAIITKGIWTTNVWIDQEDFVSGIPNRIRIENAKQREEIDKLQLQYMASREQAIMMDQNTPQISKLIFKRRMDELSGVSRELIYTYNPLTADERRVKKYLPMINNDNMPKNLMKDGMDYFTYRLYISTCNDNNTKNTILDTLEDAMIDAGLNKAHMPDQQMQWLANSMWAQQTSSFTKWLTNPNQQQNIPSLQDVKQNG